MLIAMKESKRRRSARLSGTTGERIDSLYIEPLNHPNPEYIQCCRRHEAILADLGLSLNTNHFRNSARYIDNPRSHK